MATITTFEGKLWKVNMTILQVGCRLGLFCRFGLFLLTGDVPLEVQICPYGRAEEQVWNVLNSLVCESTMLCRLIGMFGRLC